MRRMSAALATLLLMGTSALAAPPQPPAGPAGDGPAASAPAGAGPMRDGFRGGMRPGGPMHPPRAELAMHLAMHLAAAETLIGIRSDQLDAWRTYTGALIDFLTPAAPPAFAMGAAGGNFLDRQEAIATRLKDRAAKADALLAAITGLKAKLTPEQVDRLGQVDLMMHPPMRPGWGGRTGEGPAAGGGPWHRPAGPQDGPAMMGPQDMPGPHDEMMAPPEGMQAPDAAPPQDGDNPPPPAIPDHANQPG